MEPLVRPPPRGEDLPYSDGEPMESERHRDQMALLITTLNDAWRDRDDFYVGGDMFVYFSESQARKNDFRGPDVFVVMDTVRKERKSWVVWEENGRTPDVVIELLSESTEHVDRGEKMRIYARLLHVGEYYLFDPMSGVFEGYELDRASRTYRRRQVDERGRLSSPMTGLSLGVVHQTIGYITAPWLRWFDVEGNVLPLALEHAEQEAARVASLEARLREYERRFGKL
jgi:Uma2 family endonuclease